MRRYIYIYRERDRKIERESKGEREERNGGREAGRHTHTET